MQVVGWNLVGGASSFNYCPLAVKGFRLRFILVLSCLADLIIADDMVDSDKLSWPLVEPPLTRLAHESSGKP